MDIVRRKRLFDNHSHIGPVPGFAYYGLPEAVKPTTDYQTAEEYIKGMDKHKVDRALVMSNYGYPDSAQPFELNPLVAEGAETSHDRLLGAIWVSALPKDKERTREALKLIGEKGLIALKRRGGDTGAPITAADPNSPISRSYNEVASSVRAAVEG